MQPSKRRVRLCGLKLHPQMPGKRLWEVRSTLPGQIARVIFTTGESKMILLHGFIKKGQKTPKDELELAKTRLRLLG